MITEEDARLPGVNWLLRKSQTGDEPRIIDLAKNAFGRDLLPEKYTRAFWDWEFRQNPGGDSIIWVASEHKKIVGHYGILRVRVKVGDRTRTAGLVVDVMTDRSHRRRGMFTQLGKAALGDAGANRIPFCIGFPMKGSTAKVVLPGHLKVGWFVAFTIPVLARPLNFASIVESFFRSKFLAKLAGFLGRIWERLLSAIRIGNFHDGLELYPVCSFPQQIDRFWLHASKDYDIIGVRNRLWLNHRFTNVPDRDYRIIIAQRESRVLGYIVLSEKLRMNLNFGLIVDLLTYRHDHRTREALLRKAAEYFKTRGVDVIGCMFKDCEYEQDLKALGFLRSPEKYYFIIHLNTDEFNRETIGESKRWFLSWADLDTV